MEIKCYIFNVSFYMRIFLLIIIYITFISLGLPDSLLGSAWPSIYKDINVPISYLGIITMTICFMTIISSVFSNKVTSKFGTRNVTIISVLLTVLALLGFSFSNNFYMLLLFAIPYGLGAGAIDAALNNYVALHYKAKDLSWLHCFWGVGTIISPFIMGNVLKEHSWKFGYLIVSLIQLTILIFLISTMRVWNINNIGTRKEETKQKEVSIIKAIKIKGVVFVLIAFFAYCALESTTIQWASTYFVKVKNLTEEVSATYASLFFIGITFSRFINGFVTNILNDKKIILSSCMIVLIGIIILFLPINTYITALIGFIVIGFGCGPIYPSIIHSTPINFGKENSSAIIGIEMASAYIGSTFMPPLFGILGNALDFNIMPIYLVIFLTLIFFMIIISFNIKEKESKKYENISN